MSATSDEQLQALREAFAESDALSVFVFGSYARGEAGDNSDLDVGVVFRTIPDDWSNRLFEIEMRIERSDVSFPEIDFEILTPDDTEFYEGVNAENCVTVSGENVADVL